MMKIQSKSVLDPKLQIKFNLGSLKLLTYVGVFASLTVIICNTILFSFGDITNWPQWALNLSYWAGSIVLAFAAVGFIPTYFALRSAGRYWVFASGGFLAYFLSLGSSGHGSFFANYSIQQAIQNTPSIKELEALTVPLQTYNNFLLFAAVTFLLLGSVFFAITVLTRKTMYPKWMALCNPFLIVVLISIPAMIEGVPDIVKIVSKGIGFHLGFIIHYMLTYNFIRSYYMKSTYGEIREEQSL